MTEIRIKTPIAGGDFSWRPGEVVDLPAAEAAKWADGQRAEYVNDADAPPAGEDEPADDVQAEDTTHEVQEVEPPAGNASRDEWAAYVVDVLKVDPAEIENLGRNELRDRYAPSTDTEA
jgi:hypothetical protein